MNHKKSEKTKKSRKKSQDVLYVGVREPAEIRRNLLESAREFIHFLQRYEKLKGIREEKFQTILQLDTEVKELKLLVNKLRKSFPAARPHVKLPKYKPVCEVCTKQFSSEADLSKHMKMHQPKEEKSVGEPVVKEIEQKKRVLSDLEKLENELTDIEGKLGEM